MMKILSYLKSIVILTLGLGVAPAQGMRKFVQSGRSFISQFNRAAVNFGSPFAHQSPLFRASGLGSRFSALNQVPLVLSSSHRPFELMNKQGWSKAVHSTFDAQPEAKVKSEEKPSICTKSSSNKKITSSGRGLQEIRLAFDAMQGKKQDNSEKTISRRSLRSAQMINAMQANGNYVDKPLKFRASYSSSRAMPGGRVIKKPATKLKHMYPVQTLFGNDSGLQWIGAFNTAAFMAIKKAVSDIPLQPIDASAENARIEPMNNDASKHDAQANSGPEKGPEENGDHTKNNQRAMNDQQNNDRRGSGLHDNDSRRNNEHDKNNGDGRLNSERFDKRYNHNQDPRNNMHERVRGRSKGLKSCMGTTPSMVTHVADIEDEPDKDTAVVDIIDPVVVPEDPIVVDPKQPKFAIPKPKFKAPKKLRQWTPCQNAVRMYGAAILEKLQQGQMLDPRWARSSKHIAKMIKNYNEQLARAGQNNHPEVIESLQCIRYTIARFVEKTRAIMNM